MDIESFWEYGDPAKSEERFRAALSSATGDERLELLTQIARTYSLRKRFDKAHKLLDEIQDQIQSSGARPKIRYLLERGRTFNSSGERDKARKLFVEAWELGSKSKQEGHAVDAAHMVAITHSGTDAAIEWNKKGLAIARKSSDSKAKSLIPAMLNNSAWDLHGLGRFDEALKMFEEAEVAWTATGKIPQTQIAKWSVARCLRSLGQHDKALQIQRTLEVEHAKAGSEDGYVFEEIAENLAALGKMSDAKPYFAKAVAALGKDDWFVKNESARFKGLQERAK